MIPIDYEGNPYEVGALYVLIMGNVYPKFLCIAVEEDTVQFQYLRSEFGTTTFGIASARYYKRLSSK